MEVASVSKPLNYNETPNIIKNSLLKETAHLGRKKQTQSVRQEDILGPYLVQEKPFYNFLGMGQFEGLNLLMKLARL